MIQWLLEQYELYNRQLQRPDLTVSQILFLQEKCQNLAEEIDRLERIKTSTVADNG